MDGITPEEVAESADAGIFLPKRAEIAVAIGFEIPLQVQDREKLAERLSQFLNEALTSGSLVTPDLQLPQPRYVTVQPLPYKCDNCGKKVSPFVLI